MRKLIPVALLLAVAACRPEQYTPRPRGYARIDTPRQHAYQLFDRAGFPYTFEYPVYGQVSSDSVIQAMRPDNPYWMNIDFPSLGGSLYLSYKNISDIGKLDTLLNDAHQMSYFHTKKADYINAPVFHTPNNVHGVVFDVGGDAASAYQFFATDSTKHFLRGALYFNVSPNADSLRPLTSFLRQDIEHMLQTLRWR
jgi:gliding motility-associated lipoprotein GldD